MKDMLKMSDKILYAGLTISLVLMIIAPPIGTIALTIFGGIILILAIFTK